jgi:hypothetical protein
MASRLRHLPQPGECLYFLHIPKTAGTTFTNILQTHFDAADFCPATRWHDLLAMSPKEYRRFRLIAGHMSYSLHHLIPKPLLYITMLRDPVDRVISHYEMVQRAGIYFPGKSLYECVTDEKIRDTYNNIQVAMLGENYSLQELNDTYSRWDVDGLFTTPRYPIPNNEFLSRAKQRLEAFTFFGLTERFSASVNLLTYTFGWSPITAVQKLNAAPKRLRREEIPQKTLEAIIEYNPLDIELYNFASALFEQRYAQMIQELLYEDYQRLHTNSVIPVDRLELDFAQSFQGTGWQAPETEDQSIRWTGPSNLSTIDLPLTRDKELLVTFRIVNVLAQDILQSFRMKVNHQEVSLIADYSEPAQGIKLSAILTLQLLNGENPFTHLSFHVNRTVRPCDHLPDNKDERLLGVAIRDFKIVPLEDGYLG